MTSPHTDSTALRGEVESVAELLKCAKNAAAIIGAFYQWLDMVKAAGGTTSIAGIAKCHAMLKSLEGSRERTETLVMAPLRAAISAIDDECAA